MAALFISFEGTEGAGKSTQIQLFQQWLKIDFDIDAIVLREPGGVQISERIRELLLDLDSYNMSSRCETLLYMAARAQLVEEVLKPALKNGQAVICDRFLDSTIVYQGAGCGIDGADIESIGLFATQQIQPELTFWLDVPVELGMSRIQNRGQDRIELRGLDYHQRVWEGYHALWQRYPKRIKRIAAHSDPEGVATLIREEFKTYFDARLM